MDPRPHRNPWTSKAEAYDTVPPFWFRHPYFISGILASPLLIAATIASWLGLVVGIVLPLLYAVVLVRWDGRHGVS